MTTKRIVTGAHYGARDWIAQRFTAIILTLYTVYLLVRLLVMPEPSYSSWYQLFASPFMKVATLLALLSLAYHTWVGMRNVYMDYIKPTGLRLTLQIVTIVLLIGYACWALIILWKL